ncbi:hypothetical protein HDE_04728 [Halotydeus destructor]|nr:hypothetical protein HDE_04728 [Halotydeus destructor]
MYQLHTRQSEEDKNLNCRSLGIFSPVAFQEKNVLVYEGTTEAAQAMWNLWKTGAHDNKVLVATLVEIFCTSKRKLADSQFADLFDRTTTALISSLNHTYLPMLMSRRDVHSLFGRDEVQSRIERSIDKYIRDNGQFLLSVMNDPNVVFHFDPDADAYVRKIIAANP